MDIDWKDRTAVVQLGDGANAFETAFVEDLHARLDDVAADDSAQALVTVGGGRHYSNGFDIEFLGSLDGPGLRAFMDRSLGLLARLLTFPVPTVAAVNGHAFGIGAMLALAHDRRVVRADRGWWCLPEIDLGLQFHPFLLALVEHRLPAATVEEAILSGRRYDAAAAVEAGVAHGTAAIDDLVAAAVAQAQPLAGKGRDIAVALRRALHAPVLEHLDG